MNSLLVLLAQIHVHSAASGEEAFDPLAEPSCASVGSAPPSSPLREVNGADAALEGFRRRRVLGVHGSPGSGFWHATAAELTHASGKPRLRNAERVLVS